MHLLKTASTTRDSTLSAFVQGRATAMLAVGVALQVVFAVSATLPAVEAAGADVERILHAFSIRRGQIIRPVESQAAGARYLNDTMFGTNEDCLIWCWETTHCNVAIFGARPFQRPEEVQEPSAESRKCYLFDCGPGSRKCSFTDNKNYITSSLIHGSPSFHPHSHSEQILQENGRTSHPHQFMGEDLSDSSKRGPLADFHRNGNNIRPTEIVHPLGANEISMIGCFRCGDDSNCVPPHKVCDGNFDCRDKSDEASCPNSGNKKHFRYHGNKPDNEASFDPSGHLKGGSHRHLDQSDTKPKGHSRSDGQPSEHKKGVQLDDSSGLSTNLKSNDGSGRAKNSEQNTGHDHPSMSISLTQVDSGEKHASASEVQSGAILAIALGLCVTALLLVLVGCKLRLVRRRLANWRRENRKGLSLLADDDDEDDEDEDVVHGII